MGDIGGAFGAFGGAIMNFLQAAGFREAAKDYRQAAVMEGVNVEQSKASTVIKTAAAQREIYRGVGGMHADVAAAGFSFSGSAIDLAADSAGQGAIAKGLIANQGAIETQGYAIEKFMYESQARQADNAAAAAEASGFLNIFGGILSLFSDPKLKRDIVPIGKDKEGKQLYRFKYIGGSDQEFVGYMADELNPGDVVDAIGLKSPIKPEHQARAV
jgi:hypothetical protein